MILKSCYVEGFGKLREFRYEFDSGMNSLVRNNGWGKTTFAAFVKAMLYGLPASKSRNLLENERKHYEPWDRGRFGGSLTFEARGKTYRVVRYFGDKESEDYFRLYDAETEEESRDFSENLGFELFSVDAESYMKSAFIGAYEEDRFGKSPTVQERLTASVEEEDSAVSYEKAIETLEKQRKVYKLSGNKGRIGELEGELEKQKLALSQSERDRVEADRLAGEMAEIDVSLAAIAKKEEENADAQVASRSREAVESLRRHAASLLSDAVAAENNRDALRLSFGEEFPSEEFLQEAEKSVEALHELRIRAANERLSETDEARRSRILDVFGGIPPTEEQLRREAVERNAVAMREYNEKCAVADKERSARKRKRRIRSILLLAVGVVLLVLGAVLLPSLLYAALPCFALGGFSAVFAAVLLLSPERMADDGLLSPEPTLDQSRLQALWEYERIEKDATAAEERAKVLREEYAAKEKCLFADAARYGESVGTAVERISSLRRRVEQYCAAVEVATTNRNRYAAYIEDHPEAAKVGEDAPVASSVTTLDGERRLLTAEKLRLQDKRNRLSRQLLPIRASADRAAEHRDRIVVIEGELSEACRRFDAIEKAKKHLGEAKNRLAARYLSDMQAAFSRYLTRFLPQIDSRGVLSADLSLKVENGGMRYDPTAFSDGTRDVLSFCVHLSLHDALFQNEKPVLILDDTFACLDEETLARAKDFLRELSSTVQILYFTCHESRDIE